MSCSTSGSEWHGPRAPAPFSLLVLSLSVLFLALGGKDALGSPRVLVLRVLDSWPLLVDMSVPSISHLSSHCVPHHMIYRVYLPKAFRVRAIPIGRGRATDATNYHHHHLLTAVGADTKVVCTEGGVPSVRDGSSWWHSPRAVSSLIASLDRHNCE